MGSVRGRRPPNQTAYYVALAGIMALLLMLCCYFLYFCITKVKQLTRDDPSSQPVTSTTSPPPTYPVQPGVRDSATAMAKLCKQIPPAGKGDTVFPTSTSPGAQLTDTHEGDTPASATIQTAAEKRTTVCTNTESQAVR